MRWTLLLLAASAWGQTETGSLAGSIMDAAGKAVAGAMVHVTATGTGSTWDAAGTGDGAYNLPELPPGGYKLSVTARGFAPGIVQVTIPVGGRVRQDFVLLQAGSPEGTRQPAPTGINTETQTQSRLVTNSDIRNLPNLTRDAYRLAELAGNVSDAGLGTRGVGLAINGQRESSTAILFDTTDDKDEFTGSVGHSYPLDSFAEFAVLTSDFTAEYGRASGGVVNATGKHGGNDLHGTGYEYNRASALATNSFLNNANGIRLPGFERNQFGAAVGGAIVRNKLFFFTNTEGTLVRSNATQYAWIATPQLLAQTSPATQAFFQTLGQTRPGLTVLGTVTLSQLTAKYGRNPCTGFACATLPTGIPIFSHVAYIAPGDSGGGFPQNTWNSYNRLDWVVSDRTRVYGHYGIYSEHDQSGVLSNSPYASYDLGDRQVDNSFLVSATHQWSPHWISETSAAFDRITVVQQGLTSRGVVPTMYANPVAPVTIGADPIAFPGYNPFTPGVGGAFGGPENIAQLNHDTSWTKGNHLLRFGGNYTYIRDNRTDAAYQTASDSLASTEGLGATLVGLVYGTFADIQVAIDPQGKFPCTTAPTCSLNFPVTSPNFSRSDRYHDASLYAQDYWRLTRRIAVNLGVRWDFFGVQHNGNPNLDSNWYAPNIDFADSNLVNYMAQGGLQLAPKSPVGGLYKPDWKDFAPRVGAAWDVFGNGKTSVRGGYGVGYDRNFGNVTFNVIQNLPNYAVLDVPGPITTNNFGPLGASSGSLSLPPAAARIIDPGLKTAYAQFWNAAVQRQITRGVTYSLEYSGSKGVHLYSISYPNQEGFGNLYLGYSCLGVGDCRTPPNPYYSEDVGYRGNQGFSSYYGINNRLTITNLLHTGLMLNAVYTYSRAIDNISSTFFEAGGLGVTNRYGDQNITINNGLFDLGLLDPYQPNLDRGYAEFDIRHRVVVSGLWTVPGWKRSHSTRMLTGGWTVAPVFIGRSGQPFSVFDTVAQTLDLNAPRATFVASYPTRRNTFVGTPSPDMYQIITFLPAQFSHASNTLTPGEKWPSNMSARDAFRAPGFWNFDLALNREMKVTERLTLLIRAEAFNVFNHANLYVIGSTANVGAGNTVDGCFGCTGSTWDRRQFQLAARVSF